MPPFSVVIGEIVAEFQPSFGQVTEATPIDQLGFGEVYKPGKICPELVHLA